MSFVQKSILQFAYARVRLLSDLLNISPPSNEAVGAAPPCQQRGGHIQIMAAAAYEVRKLPGRGKGLVAARDLQPGEEVLVDAPLLLTPAPEARTAVCATCLRILGTFMAAHGSVSHRCGFRVSGFEGSAIVCVSSGVCGMQSPSSSALFSAVEHHEQNLR